MNRILAYLVGGILALFVVMTVFDLDLRFGDGGVELRQYDDNRPDSTPATTEAPVPTGYVRLECQLGEGASWQTIGERLTPDVADSQASAIYSAARSDGDTAICRSIELTR